MNTQDLRDHMNDKLAEKIGQSLPEKQPKQLTREQRRYKERVENEAMIQLNSFVSKFYEFFMENDPESPLIETKKKELSAKWKMYVHHKGLSTKALDLCDGNCQAIIEKYKEQLKEA